MTEQEKKKDKKTRFKSDIPIEVQDERKRIEAYSENTLSPPIVSTLEQHFINADDLFAKMRNGKMAIGEMKEHAKSWIYRIRDVNKTVIPHPELTNCLLARCKSINICWNLGKQQWNGLNYPIIDIKKLPSICDYRDKLVKLLYPDRTFKTMPLSTYPKQFSSMQISLIVLGLRMLSRSSFRKPQVEEILKEIERAKTLTARIRTTHAN